MFTSKVWTDAKQVITEVEFNRKVATQGATSGYTGNYMSEGLAHGSYVVARVGFEAVN